MTDEPICNLNADAKVANKLGYSIPSITIDGDEPMFGTGDIGEKATVVFLICGAVVASVLIVSIATYEIAKLKIQATQQGEDNK